MNLDPPPITIVNPLAPAGTADVLASGSERPPWRPSKRQVAILGSVLAVFGLVGGTYTVLDNRRADRAADKAAIDGVTLGFNFEQERGDEPEGGVLAPLLNLGTAPVRVLSFTIGSSGPIQVGEELPPGGVIHLVLPDKTPCGPEVLKAGPTSVTLTVTTHRGDAVTRVVDFATRDNPLARRAIYRCGYFPLDQSLASNLNAGATRVSGRSLVLGVLLGNSSVLPLSVVEVKAALPGLAVSITESLPLVVPIAQDPQALHMTTELTIRLRVTDCTALSEATEGAPDHLPVLEVTLARGNERSTQPLWLGDASMSEFGEPANADLSLDRLLRCEL